MLVNIFFWMSAVLFQHLETLNEYGEFPQIVAFSNNDGCMHASSTIGNSMILGILPVV